MRGNPLLPGNIVLRSTVYPRVCGGTLRPRWSRRSVGSIPACAGEPKVFEPGGETEAVYPRVCGGTAGTTVGTATTQVYPRVCGGTKQKNVTSSIVAGLSPRVRGNPGRSIPLPRTNRSIPACAGEPSPSLSRRICETVYPRVCGGTAETLRHVNYMQGLSPRVRGNPTEGYRAGFSLRSIPACAGEPRHHSPRSPLV